ncbi:MAG: hypothetical protein KH230_19510 [Enterocloster asparagiformis]|nr:hypothetical protein [Enterocloster asparagiformis]
MDEFMEQAKDYLNQRVRQIRDEHKNLTIAEKKAQMERLNHILFSLDDEDRQWLDSRMSDDVILTNEECEALYLAGLKDGLRLLKLIAI